jgi:[ribosomal protein S18]-alanine N-acetyltransferase
MITFRSLQDESDLEVCARIMAQSEPWKTLGRDYEASRNSIADPSKEVHLALVDDEIVGFSVINMTGAFTGYIQSLAVVPERRGQGIGTALLRHVEDRILSETPNVFMCVSSFNQDAMRLYERLGYAVVGELADYIITGHSEILLRKTTGPLKDFSAARGRRDRR